jgi:hypothetical protein
MKAILKNRLFDRSLVSLIIMIYLLIQIMNAGKSNAQGIHVDALKHKNTIYFETLGATGLGGSVNYKRTAWVGQKTAINASAGLGVIIFSSDGQPDAVMPFSMTFSSGIKNSIEFGGGLSWIIAEDIIAPNITIGYQHRNHNFYLWAGIVNLFLLERIEINGEPMNSKWCYSGFLPAPGFSIGGSF